MGVFSFVKSRPDDRKIKGKKTVAQPKLEIRNEFNLIKRKPWREKERMTRPARTKKRTLPIEKIVDFFRRSLKERRRKRRDEGVGMIMGMLKAIIPIRAQSGQTSKITGRTMG